MNVFLAAVPRGRGIVSVLDFDSYSFRSWFPGSARDRFGPSF